MMERTHTTRPARRRRESARRVRGRLGLGRAEATAERCVLARVGLTLATVVGASIVVAIPSSPVNAAGVLRVDADASPGGDGLSWATAFDDLQDALAASVPGDEIWVAEGTYTPGTLRDDSFVLLPDVDVLGGFDGTESNAASRDPATNVAILSGEIGTPDATDNSYHVVSTDSSLNLAAVTVSGFTITGGYADGASDVYGGGLLLDRGSITLDQLVVTDSYAAAGGAAVAMRGFGEAIVITDSQFSNNTGALAVVSLDTTWVGATVEVDNVLIEDNEVLGLRISRMTGTVTDSVVRDNYVINSFSQGGGISVHSADVVIANTKVTGNTGGIRTSTQNADTNLTLHNVLIANNVWNSGNGAGIQVNGANDAVFGEHVSTVTGHNVTLAMNMSLFGAATSGGDEVFVSDIVGTTSGNPLASASFTNTVVWNTRVNTGSGATYLPRGLDATWANSLVVHSGGSGASWDPDVGTDGGGNIDLDPRFVNQLQSINEGDYRLQLGSVAVDAGDESLLPADLADVDGDANVAEQLPLDLEGRGRVGSVALDLGAYEGAVCPAGVDRFYVDQGAAGTGLGTSWTDAFTEVRTILNGADRCNDSSVLDVWVAEGTYTPTSTGSRFSSFTYPPDGIDLYGGFSGGEALLSQRNPAANPTVLSGEIGTPGASDNSHHVVRLVDTAGRLDGFVISGGNADGAAPSDRDGAGIDIDGSSPLIANLVVDGNRADADGAGIAVSTGSFPNIFNSIIRNNTAGSFGGGIGVDASSAPSVTNSLIHGNVAVLGGGAHNKGGLQLRMTTVTGNTSTSAGAGTGGGLVTDSGGVISNTIIWGNTPALIGGTGSTGISYSNIEGSGGSASWTGTGNDNGNNVDVDPLFISSPGANFRLQPGSPLINVGNDLLVGADSNDVDGDGDLLEKQPDLSGGVRIVGPHVDLGAYELADDADSDGVPDSIDNCPGTPNADQANNDSDNNGGDVCDPDDDNDGDLDGADNCPFDSNPDQANNDGDGLGDACDPDDDNDNVDDVLDNCPAVANTDQVNTDVDDGIGTVGDGLGDACDPDDDNDGFDDDVDNCPVTWSTGQVDTDGDGIGDACDTNTDTDGDGLDDVTDNCPAISNVDQADADGDGLGDVCDPTPGTDVDVFVSLTPARFADSRDQATFDDLFRGTGPRAAGTTWEIDIAGRGDVAADASAAVINLTLLNAAGPGFATVHPCGTLPKASSVNYAAGTVEPNEVVAKLSGSGTVCVFTKTAADVIVDVVGYTPGTSPYAALTPARFADSRDQPTFDDTHRNTGPRVGDTTWEIQIADRGDVPPTATAAVINLTVTGGQAPGFATVHPCGMLPKASSLNYGPGITRPNELIAKLSPTGTICVYTKSTVDVIVDVVGFIEDTPGYKALTPARYADSRDEATFDNSHRNTGPPAGDTTWEIQIAGRGDVPADATAAVINLTVTGAAGPGFATAHPCGTLPKASSINYDQTTTRPNELIAKLSPTGTICIYAKTTTHVIIDVVGHT